MTGHRLFHHLGLMLLAGLLGTGPSAAAGADECVLCGITPGDSVSSGQPAPLEIEFETTLNFDRVIIGGGGGGGIRLSPDGVAESSGAAEAPSGRARIGRIIIHGEPGRAITVDFPKSLELTGIKGTIVSVTALVTDLPANPQLDSRGQLVVDFGGELKIDGDVDGDFRGARNSISATRSISARTAPRRERFGIGPG